MSSEPPAKRVRKSARSCVECRSRKVRCEWPSEHAQTCQGCSERGRRCEPQVRQIPVSEMVKRTSQSRIRVLENSVSQLWSAVQTLETKSGHALGHASALKPPESLRDGSRSSPPVGLDGDSNVNDDDDEDVDDNEDDSDLESASGTDHLPAYLRRLFDNDIIGSHEDNASDTSSRQASAQRKAQATSALRALIPSRQGVEALSRHVSHWLHLYNSLFPKERKNKTNDILLLYEQVQAPDPDLISMATLLLMVALTIQQAPDEVIGSTAKRIKNTSSYIKNVSDTVERIVVADDALAATLEGIEAILLFIRLQLGRAKVTKMWLAGRRVIALAELCGLPRASKIIESAALSVPASPLNIRKAELWESIRCLDRISSMMWSLPPATLDYPLPLRSLVDSEGAVILPYFLYSLANIASRIFIVDDIYSTGKPLSETFATILSIDQELRTLATKVPKTWWKLEFPDFNAAALLQFWHRYFTVRTHLPLALTYDQSQQFAFSFYTCVDACQDMARVYLALRPSLPAGFFANWIVDLQVFTSAVFLLLASYRAARTVDSAPSQIVDEAQISSLARQIVQVMEAAARRGGSPSARHCATSIDALRSHLDSPQALSSHKATLNLPLVGKIHVGRRLAPRSPENASFDPAAANSTNAVNSASQAVGTADNAQAASGQGNPVPLLPETSFEPLDFELVDPLSYAMDAPDDLKFLTDETFGTENWLTWS